MQLQNVIQNSPKMGPRVLQDLNKVYEQPKNGSGGLTEFVNSYKMDPGVLQGFEQFQNGSGGLTGFINCSKMDAGGGS